MKLNEQQRQILACVMWKSASEQLAGLNKNELDLGQISNGVTRLSKIMYLQFTAWLEEMSEEANNKI